MLLDATNKKIDAIVAAVKANVGGFLPFKGKYLDKFAGMLKSNFGGIGTLIETGYANKDPETFVSYLVRMANILIADAAPFYARPIVRLLIGRIGAFLLDNKDLLKDRVGSLPPG